MRRLRKRVYVLLVVLVIFILFIVSRCGKKENASDKSNISVNVSESPKEPVIEPNISVDNTVITNVTEADDGKLREGKITEEWILNNYDNYTTIRFDDNITWHSFGERGIISFEDGKLITYQLSAIYYNKDYNSFSEVLKTDPSTIFRYNYTYQNTGTGKIRGAIMNITMSKEVVPLITDELNNKEYSIIPRNKYYYEILPIRPVADYCFVNCTFWVQKGRRPIGRMIWVDSFSLAKFQSDGKFISIVDGENVSIPANNLNINNYSYSVFISDLPDNKTMELLFVRN